MIAPLDRWTEKEQTQAEVETYILDQFYQSLPRPPYTSDDKAQVAQLVQAHLAAECPGSVTGSMVGLKLKMDQHTQPSGALLFSTT